jgi:hypothetical protein
MVKNVQGTKIGHGWQYSVFDYGDKVKKVPHSREEMRQILLRRDVQYEEGALEVLVDRILEYRDESFAALQRMDIERSLLGDPVFLEDGSFLQDKVITLRDKLDELEGDTEGRRLVIDEYITFMFKCWKNGFSERTYNFTKNNGYGSCGVILVDLGEILFFKEEVAYTLEEKRWLESWSFLNDLDAELREYYKREMNRKLSLENLEKYWGDERELSEKLI